MWKLRPEILCSDNIPVPMHGMAPRIVLGQKWWNKVRKEAYASTNFRCQACGVHKSKAKDRKWLEGHELYDIDYPQGLMTYVETVPLCHYCHNYIHDGRLRFLLEAKKLPHNKFVAIIQHGDRLLSDNGLKRDCLEEREAKNIRRAIFGQFAKSEDWRLVIDGVEYRNRNNI